MTYRNLTTSGAKLFFAMCCLAGTAAIAAPTESPSHPAAAQAATGGVQSGNKLVLPALNMKPVIPDDPAKIAAAKDFIVLYRPRMDPKDTASMIDKAMPAMIEREKENNPKINVKKFEQDKKTELMGRASKVFDIAAHVVANHFSLQELKDLTAFYRSPLGQKLVAENPKIQMEITGSVRMLSGAPQRFRIGGPGAGESAPGQPSHK